MVALFKGMRGLWANRAFITGRIKSERGAVATEYGLLLFLIALAVAVAAGFLGAAIAGVFDSATSELGGVVEGGGEE